MKTNRHIKEKKASGISIEALEQLQSKLHIGYARSADTIWQEIESGLTENKIPVRRLQPHRIYRLAMAALLVLLLGSATLIRFYTISVISDMNTPGVQLPDGSIAYLNTGTTLTYYPLWWTFSRELKLKGEAYFQVKKGKKFSVRSKAGITTVMGTSFDIYARDDVYRVTCLTGRVAVNARKSTRQIILNPNSSAEVDASGNITFRTKIKAGKSIRWKRQFTFTHSTLQAVVENIEKRYNVQITLKTNKEYFYSGTLPNQIPVEEALNLICKPFGLTFVRKSSQSFEILQ